MKVMTNNLETNTATHRAAYSVLRNGEPMELEGGFCTGYSYKVCHHIVEHLKLVSDDIFTIKEAALIPISSTSPA